MPFVRKSTPKHKSSKVLRFQEPKMQVFLRRNFFKIALEDELELFGSENTQVDEVVEKHLCEGLKLLARNRPCFCAEFSDSDESSDELG